MKNRYALIVLFAIILFVNKAFSQACPKNIDFEDGTKSNWTCLQGSDLANTNGTYVVTLNPAACLDGGGRTNVPLTGAQTLFQHIIMSAAGGTDPNSNGALPVVCPTGGKYSCRLGDDFGGGTGTGPNDPAQAEGLSFTIDKITPQNAGVTYMYAAVLCEFLTSNHLDHEAPRFEVVITDDDTKKQIDCGYYVVNANDYKNKPNSGLKKGRKLGSSEQWWYTDWTTVSLNLLKYLGKKIKIEFRVTDCSPVTSSKSPSGQHGGYAYIDMKCSPALIVSPIICADQPSVKICAPDDYIEYDWIKISGTGNISSGQKEKCVTISNPKPGDIFKVNLKALGGCNTEMYDTLRGFTLKAETDVTLCPATNPTFDLNAIPNIINETKYKWTTLPADAPKGSDTLKNPKKLTTPNTTTTYTVVAKDKDGCTATAKVTITIACDIGVTLAPSILCPGDTAILLAKPTGGIGTIHYKWDPSPKPGDDDRPGPFKVVPKETTTYTVTITDSQAKPATASATTTITVNPKPDIKIRDTIICKGSNVVLTATGADTYTWVTPKGKESDLSTTTGPTVTASPKETTTYTIYGLSDKGCKDTATVTVNVNAMPKLLVDPKKICLGESATLTVTGAYTYTWTSSNTPSDLNTNTGSTVISTPKVVGVTTYTIVGEMAKGCIGDTTVTVTVKPIPVINAGRDTAICLGDSTQLKATGGTDYKWTGDGIKPSNLTLANPWAKPTVTTTYKVVGTLDGCVSEDEVVVSIKPLVKITVGPDVTICKGDSVPIFVYGEPTYTYLWTKPDGLSNPSSMTPKASPEMTTTYTVTGSNGQCPSDVKTVTVTVNPVPKAIFTLDKYQGCKPLFVNFGNTSANVDANTTCIWEFGDPASGALNTITTKGPKAVSHNYVLVGVYTVKLTLINTGGCKDELIRSDTIKTYGYPTADFVFTPEQADVWKPSITYFNKSIDADVTKLKWYLDTDPNKVVSAKEEFTRIYPDAGTYTMCLDVVTIHGCPDQICKPVTITPDWSFFIPNAFTPNADGKNEKFNGVGVNVIEYRMDIFDRWGLHIATINKIDTQDNRGNGWDGTVDGGSGEKQQEDCYVYKVQLTDIFHKKHYYVGRVSLIK